MSKEYKILTVTFLKEKLILLENKTNKIINFYVLPGFNEKIMEFKICTLLKSHFT